MDGDASIVLVNASVVLKETVEKSAIGDLLFRYSRYGRGISNLFLISNQS
jgi:hypothetical protein